MRLLTAFVCRTMERNFITHLNNFQFVILIGVTFRLPVVKCLSVGGRTAAAAVRAVNRNANKRQKKERNIEAKSTSQSRTKNECVQ